MRIPVLTVILAMLSSAALAQQAPPDQTQTSAMRLFASAADIAALTANAKSQRKPDQPNFIQPVVRLGPYTVNLEYRVSGLAAPASIHEVEAELFYVVDGAGTAVTGGKLRGEKRRNHENL